MPSIIKSFQYSVLFHLLLGALFILSVSNVDTTKYQSIQNSISINLVGMKAGRLSGVLGNRENKAISNPEKKHISKTSKVSTDASSGPSDNLKSTGGTSADTSLAKGSGSGSGGGGGGSSDFNESILNYFEPQYPKAAIRRGLQGELKVKILVGIQGVPLETQIIQSSGHKILDDSALEAVRKWVFKTKANNTYYVIKTIIFQIKN